MQLYNLIRVLHRDLGYIFFGMTIIYAVSGIALNHRHHWNPNYIVTREEFLIDVDSLNKEIDRNFAIGILDQLGIDDLYRTHLVAGNNFRIFVEGGQVNIDLVTRAGSMEIVRKRPFFNQINFLHYNTPKRWWTWYSDLYAAGLIIIAITGMFIIKGKNGISSRGACLAGLGIFIPLLLLWLII